MSTNLASFTDVLAEDEIANSQGSPPISLPSSGEVQHEPGGQRQMTVVEVTRPIRGAGQRGEFRSVEEIDQKYRGVFTYPYFNLIQSRVLDDALYSDKSMVVCAPTGSGKTVVFELAIIQLLMELENKNFNEDFKIIYMAPVKALCTERLTEWYSKFTQLGLMCIEVTGDTDVDFSQLKPYRIIITTPEKWDMLTRRWRDHKGLVETIKLFLIDEVHILNDDTRGPVLEAVVSRMKTIESSAQSVHRIERLQKQYQDPDVNVSGKDAPRIRFVAVSATINNPEDVAAWLGSREKPAVYYKFGDECRPVKLKRIVEGYPCPEGTSIFKFDIILNYKLWPVIQKYHDGKPTLIFCNTRKSVALTAEALSRELTISFTPEQKARLTAVASTIKNKKLQALVLSGVGCHHAGLLFEERVNIENAFRNRDLPILITTTTLAMGVNLPAHLVIVKNTQQYVNGAYQEYSISTVLQMVGRAGRPQFDTEATAVIMTRLADKPRYQALVGGSEPLQSFLHKRLPENLNSEAALGTVTDVAQCVQWLRSTFLYVRAARDPKWYLGLPPNAPPHQISKKIEELCVTAMNGLASAGLITMDEASCIESTEAGRLMSIYYLDLQTMKQIIKIEGTETLERLLWIICESHELSDMHLRVEERRCLNALNRNNAAATIRFPMKGKISTRQMKLNCVIQAVLGCLPIPDPSLNQEAMKIMRIADRVCKCLVAYLTRPDLVSGQPKFYPAVFNSLILAKCVSAHLWENSPYVSKQLKGIGPTFSTLLATAGKTNFMLLEESHPRDLERIMNKGAPAGNVIRRQVSLLPKYQLSMMPIDEKKVSIQLTLLNKEHLAEHMDNLTAGDRHKSYIVVGDSENHLLLLAAFQDKDLISVYDGTITYEITRKHNFEHKILIHCVSSNFVGIDVQDEYTFTNIEPLYTHGVASITYPMEEPTKEKPTLKQTSITDVYKERKRKCNETDVTQSKEKKKRESALIDKFRNLKESFGYKSKKLMQDLYETSEASNKILTEMTTQNNEDKSHIQCPSSDLRTCVGTSKNLTKNNVSNNGNDSTNDIDYPEMNIDHLDDDNDDFMADECVDSILKEIETEISKTNIKDLNNNKTAKTLVSRDISYERAQVQSDYFTNPSINNEGRKEQPTNQNHQFSKTPCSKVHDRSLKRRRRNINPKSNFTFMEALRKKTDYNRDEEVLRDSGFSETIKDHIEKFLLNAKTTCNQTDTALNELLGDRKTEQTPIYCGACANNPDTNIIDLSNCPKKQQRNVGNETENNDKDSKEGQIPERDFKNRECLKNNYKASDQELIHEKDNNDEECPISEHLKPIDTKSYDLNDDLLDLPACSISKEDTNKQTTTFISDQKSVDLSIALPKGQSRDVKSNECVPIHNDVKNTIKSKSLSKIQEKDIDDNIFQDHHLAVPQVMHLTDNMEISEKSDLDSKISNQNNDLLIENSIINLATKNTDKELQLNKNNKHESAQEIRASEIKTGKHAENVIHKLSVSDNDHEYNSRYDEVKGKSHINRYLFTSTKIDVTSKNTEDFQIQYIRKLKVDLDVMEIVSKRKNQAKVDGVSVSESQRNDVLDTHCNFNNSVVSRNDNINNRISNHLNYTECREIDRVSEKERHTDNDDNNISLKNHIIDNKIENVYFVNDKLSIIETKTNFNPIMVDTEEKSCSEAIHYNKLCKEDNSMTLNKDDSDTNDTDIKCERNNRDLDVTDKEKFSVNNDVKVESILDKYSQILKKNDKTVNTNITATQNLHNGNDSKKPLTEKNKRPFKISDIHKLETPLPKSLIVDVMRSPRPIDDDVLKRIHERISVHSQPAQENKPKQDSRRVVVDVLRSPSLKNDIEESEIVMSEASAQHTVQYSKYDDHYSGEDDYSYAIPETLPLETEFNIVDQSMFDPKTVIQSFSKEPDEEIIPPPLEFCDDISYSPTRAEYDDLAQGCYHDTVTVLPKVHNIHDLPRENDDVNEDVRDFLTPSKEIETWTLSKEEDEWETCEFQRNPIRSLTVTHINSPGDNFDLSGENSRPAKLCHFKFTRKRKMRI